MAAGGFKIFTTGEVLTSADTNNFLMQGILVFANAAARDAAITAPEEGQACYLKDTDAVLTYSGSTWVGFDDSNAIQNAIINAKGDLIAGSANDTPSILAAGGNGETLVADSSTATGLRYNPTNAAGKNIVINGGFDIYQRTAISTSSTAYGLDRWITEAAGSASATVLTQQTTGAPNGSRYCMRVAMGASGGYGNQSHLVETSNAAQLWGKTVTISVKLRRNATYTGTLSVTVAKSATVDAGVGATWATLTATGGTNVATNANLPTGTASSDWLTISYQVNVPNDNTANSLRVSIGQSVVEASGAYWEMAQVQLEAGSVATAFSRAGGSIQGELAACQRYYQRITPSGQFSNTGSGVGVTTTTASMNIAGKVTMRITPTAIDFLNIAVSDGSGAYATTALSVSTASSPDYYKLNVTTASGLVQFRPYVFEGTSASHFIAFSAEL